MPKANAHERFNDALCALGAVVNAPFSPGLISTSQQNILRTPPKNAGLGVGFFLRKKIEKNDPEWVDFLLNIFDVNKPVNGEHLLPLAVERAFNDRYELANDLVIVSKLLANGANPNLSGFQQRSALAAAARWGSSSTPSATNSIDGHSVINLLVAHGVDFSFGGFVSKKERRETPFMTAVHYGEVQTIQKLFNLSCLELDVPNTRTTPLGSMVDIVERRPIVDLLVALGAHPEAKPSKGMSAIEILCKKPNKENAQSFSNRRELADLFSSISLNGVVHQLAIDAFGLSHLPRLQAILDRNAILSVIPPETGSPSSTPNPLRRL
jgi:hypothetical protein